MINTANFVKPDGKVSFLRKEYNYLFDVEQLLRWRAEKGQYYYYINDLYSVIQAYDENIAYDDNNYELGNYFQTREEAEEMRNKIINLLKERKI